MLQFENSAAIQAVSSLKNLTCVYLLGELDRHHFDLERRRLLSDLQQNQPPAARRAAAIRPFGEGAGIAYFESDDSGDTEETGDAWFID